MAIIGPSLFIMDNGPPIMGGVGWGGEGLKPIGSYEARGAGAPHPLIGGRIS